MPSKDFFYRACHATVDTPDPVAYWQGMERAQQRTIERIQGMTGSSCAAPMSTLSLSIKGRKFKNACGINNLPDGEIYTGPVEDSAKRLGALHVPGGITGAGRGRHRARTLRTARVVKASARNNQDYLLRMLDTDPARATWASSPSAPTSRSTASPADILFDEKIGGTFHMALGAGYPETGSVNTSTIHWDMICDLRTDLGDPRGRGGVLPQRAVCLNSMCAEMVRVISIPVTPWSTLIQDLMLQTPHSPNSPPRGNSDACVPRSTTRLSRDQDLVHHLQPDQSVSDPQGAATEHQVAQCRPQLPRGPGIQVGGRLIQQQNRARL